MEDCLAVVEAAFAQCGANDNQEQPKQGSKQIQDETGRQQHDKSITEEIIICDRPTLLGLLCLEGISGYMYIVEKGTGNRLVGCCHHSYSGWECCD